MFKYIAAFFISMVPLIELRLGVPFAIGMGMDQFTAIAVCAVGNIIPVPIIYFFTSSRFAIRSIWAQIKE